MWFMVTLPYKQMSYYNNCHDNYDHSLKSINYFSFSKKRIISLTDKTKNVLNLPLKFYIDFDSIYFYFSLS